MEDDQYFFIGGSKNHKFIALNSPMPYVQVAILPEAKLINYDGSFDPSESFSCEEYKLTEAFFNGARYIAYVVSGYPIEEAYAEMRHYLSPVLEQQP